MLNQSNIAIVGSGSVGASIAYALMLKEVTSEIIMVDTLQDLAKGQALDLGDAGLVCSTKVHRGTHKEASQADIIIITAGVKQKEEESRTDLIDRNYKILQTILGEMQPIRIDAILLLVSNPVDVLTAIAQKLSGLPPHQVIGSGTFLDSCRLRIYIADTLHVNSSAVHVYVLGEHGNSQMIAWSAATVGGKPLLSFPEIKTLDKDDVYETIMNKAMEIIRLKGSTHYGIGACAADLCSSILQNKLDIRPVSVYVDKYDTVISMPSKLGRNGIEAVYDIPLSEKEESQLLKSVKVMKSMINSIK
ncbi:lactate dehydrogenase [Spinellus fusiger]|nr:lactate dehydrogenase [Spinellus fusiger]